MWVKRAKSFFSDGNVILWSYVIIAVIIGVQHFMGGPQKYNNFVIFRAAFPHLLEGRNLYLEYPGEYVDLFLYFPAFTVLFLPFSLLPVLPSLVLWLIFCALVLLVSVRSLPVGKDQKTFISWFILIELVTSLHSQQTNPLIAACGLATFAMLEKRKTGWAALFPVLAFCIKGYGGIFAILFLYYPQKWKFIGYSVAWFLGAALLPLPFTGVSGLLQVYRDWLHCLASDHGINIGLSIMGLVHVWVSALSESAVTLIQLGGLALLTVTLFLRRHAGSGSPGERMAILAYLLLWVIMYNHAAESPTYIIPVTGVAIFYIVYRHALYPWPAILAWVTLLFCILAPTDIYPPSIRKHFFEPYLIKAIPCFLVYILLQIQLFKPWNHQRQPEEPAAP